MIIQVDASTLQNPVGDLFQSFLDSFFQSKDAPTMFNGIFWEVFNLSLWLVMLIYCIKKRGKWDTIKIFLIAMGYGLVLENGGPLDFPILGFEGYFWEENYQLYLFEFFGYGFRVSRVPLATHLGWSNVFLVSLVFWEQIAKAFPQLNEGKKAPILGGLIMAMSGWLMDLQLDPIATRFNWWVWNEVLLPLWFGVPIINYIAWFFAVGTFGAFWVWIHNKYDDPKKQTKWLTLTVPIMWVANTIFVLIIKSTCILLGLMYV